ncbi:hypothetical protein BM221_008993 [Beauveria bassiana]|uniref:Uncharacterized protein n=1 Tax=Beauveria bassiana TaxID=176275 RepID=A0A2N6N931_BEABA|nr:hypothetical protein BM221_010501 [Beauveria bassiana]PMB65632.1 hypothetical protein BM221_008993 [Beauveria bassiana]
MDHTSLSGSAPQVVVSTLTSIWSESVALPACTANWPSLVPSDIPASLATAMSSANVSSNTTKSAPAPSGAPLWPGNSSSVTVFPSSAPSASSSSGPPVPTMPLANTASGAGMSFLAVTLAAATLIFLAPYGS